VCVNEGRCALMGEGCILVGEGNRVGCQECGSLLVLLYVVCFSETVEILHSYNLCMDEYNNKVAGAV